MELTIISRFQRLQASTKSLLHSLFLLSFSAFAEGMSLRYGVAIFGVYEGGLEKRGTPPCVGVRLGMGVMCCLFLIYFVLCCEQGVLHQCADGHWTYAARNWGDEAAKWSHFVEIHIAVEFESALGLGGW